MLETQSYWTLNCKKEAPKGSSHKKQCIDYVTMWHYMSHRKSEIELWRLKWIISWETTSNRFRSVPASRVKISIQKQLTICYDINWSEYTEIITLWYQSIKGVRNMYTSTPCIVKRRCFNVLIEHLKFISSLELWYRVIYLQNIIRFISPCMLQDALWVLRY